MAAGLSETVMDWTEIIEAMDADAPAKKRGSYKKQVFLSQFDSGGKGFINRII